jgi:threonine dehydrogenase-like Zn-dependent dehydrogenase
VDVAATIKRRHGADGVDVAFECTGSSIALHEAIRVVRRRGLVVAVGFYQHDAIGLRLGEEFHHNGIRITMGQIGNVHPSHDWASLRAETIRLCRAGSVVFGGLPRLTVRIEEAASGIDALRRPDEVLQVALSYDGP